MSNSDLQRVYVDLQAHFHPKVVNRSQGMFTSRVSTIEQIVVPGAKHGLLLETDAIRGPVLTRIVAFLDRLALRK